MILLIDDSEVMETLDRLEISLGRGLGVAAQAVATEAEAVGIRSMNRGVYDTPPGTYDRTGRLSRSFRVFSSAPGTGSLVLIAAENTAPYAAYIEYGVLDGAGLAGAPGEIDVPGYRPGARVGPGFGRSGEGAWWMPQPHVRPAALYAAWKLERHILDQIKRA